MIHLEFAAHIDTSPAVKTFLRTDTDQTAGAYRILFLMEPLRKTHLEFIIPHGRIVKRKILLLHGLLRHGAYPDIFLVILPGPPEGLVHRCTRRYPERHAHTVYIQDVLVRLQYPVHIVDGHLVLNLIVHVKHSQTYFQIIPPDVVDTHIQQNPTILSSRERYINIIKLVKYYFQSLLC